MERGPASLVGHRFPGGSRAVEHWENWLLTDCTRRGPMADGLLHPVVLFHVPIQAAATSIPELFALGGSDGSPGSVTLLGYDWEYLAPLHEGVSYAGRGGIVEAERRREDDGSASDDVAFSIELVDPDGTIAARVTNRWRFGLRRPHGDPAPGTVEGMPLPGLVVEGVGVDRMKTMAALLRDPYPIHWDPDAVKRAGHGDRPVNQGPLNLAYVANMLLAWAGDDALRRLTVCFHGRVFAGDTVEAGGAVEELRAVDDEDRARCAVWLDRGEDRIVSGWAEVAIRDRGMT